MTSVMFGVSLRSRAVSDLALDVCIALLILLFVSIGPVARKM